MIFKTHIPGYPLNMYIRDFFYFEGFTPGHSMDRFLPDGNTDIVIDLTDEPKYIYDNETLKEIQSCHNVWVSGVRTGAITIPSGTNHRMLVVSFKKGRAFPFYPFPADEITNYVVDADLIYGHSIIDLRERLKSIDTIERRFQLVEDFFYSFAKNQLEPSTVTNCMQYAVGHLVSTPSDTTMRTLSERIGYSQKHFTALFKRHIGLTPKRYMRVLRFQKSVEVLESRSTPEWSQVALNCGYYDQAHFINEFRHFSGFSPTAYFERKGATLNYVPID